MALPPSSKTKSPWEVDEEIFVNAVEMESEPLPSDETRKQLEAEPGMCYDQNKFDNDVTPVYDNGSTNNDPPGVDSTQIDSLSRWPSPKNFKKFDEESDIDDGNGSRSNGNVKGNIKLFKKMFGNGRGKGEDTDPSNNGDRNNNKDNAVADSITFEQGDAKEDPLAATGGTTSHKISPFGKVFRNSKGLNKKNPAIARTGEGDPSLRKNKDGFAPEEFTYGEAFTFENLIAGEEPMSKSHSTAKDTFPPDCYSIIAVYGPFDKKLYFYFGLMVFVFQMLFLTLGILSNVSKTRDIDNPHSDSETALFAKFVPSNVPTLVRITQITAILCFFIFADSSLRDCVVAIELFPRFDKSKGKENLALVMLSCVLRFIQGLTATVVTFFLIVSSENTIEIILNFAAINFISNLDECAFDLARWGKYGPALEKVTKSIEKRQLPPCMYRKYNHIRYLYTVLPILLIIASCMFFIIFKQEFGLDWRTQTTRVQFLDASGLEPFSGCFKLDENSPEFHKRKTYKSYDGNVQHAVLGYCKDDLRWVFFKDDGNSFNTPCDIGRENELAHSSTTGDFDISSSSDEIWYSASGTPLEMYFFDTEGNGDDLVETCGSFLNNGICDEGLNTMGYHYDEGDCCAATCDQINCGHGGADNIFESNKPQGDTGIGFHNCVDPSMVPVTIYLNSITSSRQDNITLTPREPTFHVYCDSINVLSINIDDTMEGKSETLMLKDGAHCRVSVINSTSVDDDLADPIWWVDYSIYQGRNDTNEILHQFSGDRDTVFFDLIQLCYFEKLKGYIDITTAYSSLALNWLVTDDSGYSDCDESFLLERFALSEMNFGAAIVTDSNDIWTTNSSNSSGLDLISSSGKASAEIDGGNEEALWIRREQQCRWEGIACDKGLVESISLQHYGVRGTIPTSIGLFPGLKRIDYDFNDLYGTIPTEVGMLTDLTGLDFDHNKLDGTIPSEFGQLTNLVELDLDNCHLEGTIPTEFGLMTKATDLELHHNKISGPIPHEIGNLKRMKRLDFTDNHIYGTIPDSVLSMGSLTDFLLGINHMIGRIDPKIGKMSSLVNLDLDENNFSGTIPTEIGLLTTLTSMKLHGNSFTGLIPSEIGLLTNLEALHLEENSFEGTLPSQIESLLQGQLVNLTADGYIQPTREMSSGNIMSESPGNIVSESLVESTVSEYDDPESTIESGNWTTTESEGFWS